jgi:hypothetical protein
VIGGVAAHIDPIGGEIMKAGIFFTGSGPIVVLTSYDSLAKKELVEKFRAKGIKKFIAYEVPVELVRETYGTHYDVVMNDLKQEDDLRVMDYNGHHVFYSFSLKELKEPVYYED